MYMFKKVDIKNRIVLVSIVSIVLVLMLLIGNNYSIFVSSNIDENLNVYKTDNLDIIYTLSEDNVNFLDVTPTSIEDSYRLTVNNVTSGYYDLYIGSKDVIKGINLSYYFSNMTNVDSIDFSNLDTSITRDVGLMFYFTGYNSTIMTLDLGSNFDTSNVTNMLYLKTTQKIYVKDASTQTLLVGKGFTNGTTSTILVKS